MSDIDFTCLTTYIYTYMMPLASLPFSFHSVFNCWDSYYPAEALDSLFWISSLGQITWPSSQMASHELLGCVCHVIALSAMDPLRGQDLNVQRLASEQTLSKRTSRLVLVFQVESISKVFAVGAWFLGTRRGGTVQVKSLFLIGELESPWSNMIGCDLLRCEKWDPELSQMFSECSTNHTADG